MYLYLSNSIILPLSYIYICIYIYIYEYVRVYAFWRVFPGYVLGLSSYFANQIITCTMAVLIDIL